MNQNPPARHPDLSEMSARIKPGTHRFVMLGITVMSGMMMPARAEVPPPTGDKPVPALKDSYKNDFLIGVAVGPYVYQSEDKAIGELVAKHFNCLTCENAMKWASLHPAADMYTFETADKLVEFAKTKTMQVVGHTLVWEQQTPEWVFKGADGKDATRDILLGKMREHIEKVAGRYRGKIKGWDVVNEALAGGGKEWLSDSPWKRIIGEDYVLKAYEYAQEADPKAELYYNDYDLENPLKRERCIRLVKSLMDKGIKIHAVGNQAHWSLTKPSIAEIEQTIKDFVALGVKINFTELDVTLYNWGEKNDIYQAGAPPEVLQQQAARYAAIFALFHRYRQHIERVTFWGPTDKYSWLNSFPVRHTNHPLLFDRAGLPKPAFWSVSEAAGEQKPR